MSKLRVATAWLGGCSGCHMSFLDLDEWLFDLAEIAEIVYSPVADVKEFPEGVDLALVEGAVANEENLELARRIRANSKKVVSFGDCAVTGNVTAMRNPLGDPDLILQSVYVDSVDLEPQIPRSVVPALLPKVLPLHKVITVDFYLPGCPPSAPEIRRALEQLTSGEIPRDRGEDIRFG